MMENPKDFSTEGYVVAWRRIDAFLTHSRNLSAGRGSGASDRKMLFVLGKLEPGSARLVPVILGLAGQPFIPEQDWSSTEEGREYDSIVFLTDVVPKGSKLHVDSLQLYAGKNGTPVVLQVVWLLEEWEKRHHIRLIEIRKKVRRLIDAAAIEDCESRVTKD
jgi:hypothetical protein